MSLLRLFLHDPQHPLVFNSGTFFLCFTLLLAGYLMLLSHGRERNRRQQVHIPDRHQLAVELDPHAELRFIPS